MVDLSALEKYRMAKPTPTPTYKQTLITRANEEIRIETLLNDLFGIYVPMEATSWKTTCPLFDEHEDGGLDKQFRVYSESNNAYCFAMHGSFDNIKLWRLQNLHSTSHEAAEAILSAYGKHTRTKSYQERIEALQSHTEPLDADPVVEAFNVFLSTQPRYKELQYRQEVLHAVNSFLESVTRVCSEAKNIKEVEEWYQAEKVRVSTLINSLA